MTQPRLPTFLFLGPPKTASTWLFEALRAHPEVFVPPAKDIYYFSRFHDRGPKWYASFFTNARHNHTALGEISIGYFGNHDAHRRIIDELPDCKLMCCVRNPVDRAISHYLFLKRNGLVRVGFREAFADPRTRIFRAGDYFTHLEALDRVVPPSQLKVLVFDDLEGDPAGFCSSVYYFVGVDPRFRFAKAQNKILPATRSRSATAARLAKCCAHYARQAGLANVVGKVKSNELVFRLLYKTVEPKEEAELQPDDRAHVVEAYREGVHKLSARLDRDLTGWLGRAAPPSGQRAIRATG